MNDIQQGIFPSFLIAKVAVDKVKYNFDKIYDYLIPDELKEKAKPGCRVFIQFGNSKENRQGLIISIEKVNIYNKKTKTIQDIIDDTPLLNEEMIKLAMFIKNRYFCTLYEAITTIIPIGAKVKVNKKYKITYEYSESVDILLPGEEKCIVDIIKNKKNYITINEIIKKAPDIDKKRIEKIIEFLIRDGIVEQYSEVTSKVKNMMVTFVKLNNNISIDIEKLTLKQRIIYDFLKDKKEIPLKELLYFTGVTSSIVNRLEEKNIVQYIDKVQYRNPHRNFIEQQADEIVLTEEQKKSFNYLYDRYKSGVPGVSLLFGVTGSGKTSVFMSLIDKVIEDKKGVIVMVPEIALTPQLVETFRKRFGERIAVLHSGLSIGERLDEWKRIKEKKADIAIGTRSAIFAPFNNIGLIIMDEEQESSYKSEANPRFHARELAKFRCNEHKCLLVLSSATPSIESYYFANKGIYGLTKINKRYGKEFLPEVSVIDMNEGSFDEDGNREIFSNKLKKSLKDNLKNNMQSIILLNRRGYSTFISCPKCKEVLTCPRCSVSMIYHSTNNRFMCHYCGYSQARTRTCPKCGEDSLVIIGCGTQKVQERLQNLFPEARILRMDADSITSKFAYEENINSFSKGEYDIMIGTQMVAKGLNFPKVTLSCILSADQTLYGEDFRSYERAFSLITQTVGRSGRGDSEGRAIIQTYTPENPIIELASAQDYESFYDTEIKLRKAMLYPPFSDIAMVSFYSKDEEKAKNNSKLFVEVLKSVLNKDYVNLPISILGPSSALILKVNEEYRYKVVIKYKSSKQFRSMLSQTYAEFLTKIKSQKIVIDINPNIII